MGEFIDWLTLRLTGEWAASINTASIRLLRSQHRRLAGWTLRHTGLDDPIERFRRAPDMGTVVGTLRADVAAELASAGLIPAAEGGADASLPWSGWMWWRQGRFITACRRTCRSARARTEFHAKGIFGTYTDAVMPGQQTVEGGQVPTGLVVGQGSATTSAVTRRCAERRGVDTWPQFSTRRRRPCRSAPTASSCSTTGRANRTPLRGPGGKRHHARLLAAPYDGPCLPRHHGGHQLWHRAHSAQHPRTATPCKVGGGGGGRGDQEPPVDAVIHADVSNVPIALTEVADAPTLGFAILAAVGAGLFP